MIYDRQLSEISYIQKKVSDISNASRFPFFIKKIGFMCENTITFDSDGNETDWILLYSLSGMAEITCNDEIRHLRGTELAAYQCCTSMRFNQVTDDKWEFLFLVFNGSHAEFLFNIISEKSNIFNINPPSLIIQPFIHLLELDYNDSDAAAMKASALLHIIMSVLYDSSLKMPPYSALFPNQYIMQVNTAINFIKENYAGDCSVDKICSYAGFSKYHFSRIFKDITGVTIHKFVNRHRINKATDLLSDTDMSISEIYETVGFNDIETFTRVFKSIKNVTPAEYRRRLAIDA